MPLKASNLRNIYIIQYFAVVRTVTISLEKPVKNVTRHLGDIIRTL